MALPGSNMEQLNFGERDLSNAAKEIRRPTPPRLPERPCSPLLSQTDPLRPFEVQVPDMIRQLLGAVNQLVSFATTMADVKFKGDEVHNRCTALENDVAFLRARTQELSTKVALDELRNEGLAQTSRDDLRFAALEARAALFENLDAKSRGYEKWILETSELLTAHGKQLENHAEDGLGRDARLVAVEAWRKEQAEAMARVQQQHAERAAEVAELKKVLALALEEKDAGLAALREELGATRARLAAADREAEDSRVRISRALRDERAQTKEDVQAARAAAAARASEAVEEQARMNQDLAAGTAKVELTVAQRVEKGQQWAAERLAKLASDAERQAARLQANIDKAAATAIDSHEGLLSSVDARFKESHRAAQLREADLRSEIGKKLEGFKDVIRSFGPEISEIVHRVTGDILQDVMAEHNAKEAVQVRAELAAKHDLEAARAALKKKVDVQALAGYAHKEEVVALVAQAVQDKERQMERRLGFAMLSTQVPRATAGAAAQADAERLLVVQADLIRQGGAIADLFQVVRTLTEEMRDWDSRGRSSASFRGRAHAFLRNTALASAVPPPSGSAVALGGRANLERSETSARSRSESSAGYRLAGDDGADSKPQRPSCERPVSARQLRNAELLQDHGRKDGVCRPASARPATVRGGAKHEQAAQPAAPRAEETPDRWTAGASPTEGPSPRKSPTSGGKSPLSPRGETRRAALSQLQTRDSARHSPRSAALRSPTITSDDELRGSEAEVARLLVRQVIAGATARGPSQASSIGSGVGGGVPPWRDSKVLREALTSTRHQASVLVRDSARSVLGPTVLSSARLPPGLPTPPRARTSRLPGNSSPRVWFSS